MTCEAKSITIWRAIVKEFDKAEHAQKERDRRTGLSFHSMMKDFEII